MDPPVAYTIEWAHPGVWLSGVWAAGSTPLYVYWTWRLWQRRHLFPLNKRGTPLLLVFALLILLSTLAWCVPHLWYPLGLPCGLQIVLQYTGLVLMQLVFAARGWTLFVRWEITAQLAKFRQAQPKQTHYTNQMSSVAAPMSSVAHSHTDSRAVSRDAHDQQPNSSPHATLPAAIDRTHKRRLTSPNTYGHAQSVRSSSKSTMSLSISSGASDDSGGGAGGGRSQLAQLYEGRGGWYVRNRHIAEAPFLLKVCGLVMGLVILLLVLFYFVDPDQYRDGHTAAYGTDIKNAFIYGHYGEQPANSSFDKLLPCPLSSIKSLLILGQLLLSTIPFGVLINRLVKKEQDGAGIRAEMLALSASSGVTAVLYGAASVFVGLACAPVVYAWFFSFFYFGVVLPVRRSCKLEREQQQQTERQQQQQQQQRPSALGGANKVCAYGGASSGSSHAHPLTQLINVVAHPAACAAFVHFSEKEFSSENISFFIEAKQFARLAKHLEERMSWQTAQVAPLVTPQDSSATAGDAVSAAGAPSLVALAASAAAPHDGAHSIDAPRSPSASPEGDTVLVLSPPIASHPEQDQNLPGALQVVDDVDDEADEEAEGEGEGGRERGTDKVSQLRPPSQPLRSSSASSATHGGFSITVPSALGTRTLSSLPASPSIAPSSPSVAPVVTAATVLPPAQLSGVAADGSAMTTAVALPKPSMALQASRNARLQKIGEGISGQTREVGSCALQSTHGN